MPDEYEVQRDSQPGVVHPQCQDDDGTLVDVRDLAGTHLSLELDQKEHKYYARFAHVQTKRHTDGNEVHVELSAEENRKLVTQYTWEGKFNGIELKAAPSSSWKRFVAVMLALFAAPWAVFVVSETRPVLSASPDCKAFNSVSQGTIWNPITGPYLQNFTEIRFNFSGKINAPHDFVATDALQAKVARGSLCMSVWYACGDSVSVPGLNFCVVRKAASSGCGTGTFVFVDDPTNDGFIGTVGPAPTYLPNSGVVGFANGDVIDLNHAKSGFEANNNLRNQFLLCVSDVSVPLVMTNRAYLLGACITGILTPIVTALVYLFKDLCKAALSDAVPCWRK